MRALTTSNLTTRTPTTSRRGLRAACSTLAVAAFVVVCASSAGPVRQIAGLGLAGALLCAAWLVHRARFEAIVPAAGLTLVFLVLAGLALAAVHALSTVPFALTLTLVTLAALWAGALRAPAGSAGSAERSARLNAPPPLAAAGVLAFAAAAVLAVHHGASAATADADAASSVAIWAYPSGGQLQVGARQPAGRGGTSLRIVVTQAGVTVATWNDIRLAPGGTWQAPAFTVTGDGPVRVVALHGGTVVASLSNR
ncbi:hypothetical protein KGA66_16800 [Actinocrinis puniceicyclus]|uniref:Uncharacterized protein n=1 Tax=Actinocrinis puniceicyclus TaxID=977794 RepID=A0A8J8BFG1_9ACTN|nr:hypothetical protein [Actinocrinis puniceicyclus]MBS2964719.1 hypothetical protein [Actinocrinis puniceicyclus]